MAVHESKVSVDTLKWCRGLVVTKLEDAERDRLEAKRGSSARWKKDCKATVADFKARLAELDAEIAAKEAEES